MATFGDHLEQFSNSSETPLIADNNGSDKLPYVLSGEYRLDPV